MYILDNSNTKILPSTNEVSHPPKVMRSSDVVVPSLSSELSYVNLLKDRMSFTHWPHKEIRPSGEDRRTFLRSYQYSWSNVRIESQLSQDQHNDDRSEIRRQKYRNFTLTTNMDVV